MKRVHLLAATTLVASLAAGTAFALRDDGSSTSVARDEAGAVGTAAPIDVPVPLLLTCPDNSRTQLIDDFSRPPDGPATAEELVARASTPDEPWVLSGNHAYVLRPDGTAFEMHDIVHGPNGFYFEGYTSC